jgi:hypothetical protein
MIAQSPVAEQKQAQHGSAAQIKSATTLHHKVHAIGAVVLVGSFVLVVVVVIVHRQ